MELESRDEPSTWWPRGMRLSEHVTRAFPRFCRRLFFLSMQSTRKCRRLRPETSPLLIFQPGSIEGKLITPFDIPCHGIVRYKKREPSEAGKDQAAGERNKDDEATKSRLRTLGSSGLCPFLWSWRRLSVSKWSSRISPRRPFSSHDLQSHLLVLSSRRDLCDRIQWLSVCAGSLKIKKEASFDIQINRGI